MKKIILILSIFVFQFTNGQLDPNGILILNSGTTAEINAISPQTGALVFNTETNKTYVYNGSTWEIATGNNENWTTSGNNQYSAVSGNVGIGTTNPSYKLDIGGNSSLKVRLRGGSSDYTNAAIILEATESTNYRGLGIFMHDDNGNNEWYMGRPYAGSDRFVINRQAGVNGHQGSTSDDNTNNLFTMLNSGNVGIGNPTPDTKLDIKDDSIDYNNVDAIAGSNNAWNQHGLKITGSNNSMNFIVSNQFNDRRAIIQAGHENIAYAQHLSTLALNPFGGNVGIGTKSPSTKLEVAGQVKITGGSPGNGKVLTSDANGLATWQDASSTTNNSILIDGKDQTMFGNTGGSTGNCIVSHGIATFFTNASNNNFIHIRLPYTLDSHNEMYHIKATGYRYGAAKVIDITWVGYCYRNGNALINASNINNGGSEFSITQYVGSDRHIYLRFRGTTGSNYYQSFRIDSMNVGNGSVLTEGDIQIISSASANL